MAAPALVLQNAGIHRDMQDPVLLLGSGGSLKAQNLVFHISCGCYFHPPQEVFILSVLVTDSFKARRAS